MDSEQNETKKKSKGSNENHQGGGEKRHVARRAPEETGNVYI